MGNGFSGLERIQARIGEIEARIATMTGAGAAAEGIAFSEALGRAMGASGGTGGPAPAPLSARDLRSLPPPPGWVGPMPVKAAPSPVDSGPTGVARWEEVIQKYAGQYDVSADLVRAVMTAESSGDPRAVSPAGAMGLMQLMPATARGAGVTDPFDPEQNVRAGVALLRQNLDRYDGDVRLALAAYNAGPGNVAKYDGIPPFRETQNYVRKIMTRLGGAE